MSIFQIASMDVAKRFCEQSISIDTTAIDPMPQCNDPVMPVSEGESRGLVVK